MSLTLSIIERIEYASDPENSSRFKVFINPTKAELKAFSATLLHDKELRITKDSSGNFYAWDAMLGTHAGTMFDLGVDRNYQMGTIISAKDLGEKYDWDLESMSKLHRSWIKMTQQQFRGLV